MHIIISLIIILFSPTVIAEIVPTPKSITFVCDDNVKKGTVVLTNPPTFSCEDYETITSLIGTGIVVGPDTRVEEISSAIKDITGNQPSWRWPDAEPLQACSHPFPPQACAGSWDSQRDWRQRIGKLSNNNYREQNPENSKNSFYGISRNKKWFNESGRGAWMPITGDDNETRQPRRRSAQGRKRFQ